MIAALDPRQRQVLALVGDGLDASTIAAELGLTHAVVKHELAGIRQRLGARNTAHAIAIAHRAGLLPLGGTR